MKRGLSVSIVTILFFSIILVAQAETITFNLDLKFGGDINLPPGQDPWLIASFQDIKDNSLSNTYNAVELKLIANGLTTQNEFVSEWYFNYNKSVALNFSLLEGPGTSSEPSVGNFFADGAAGTFDILFGFSNESNLFTKGETAIFLIEGFGISAGSFNLLNDPGNYYSAAEIVRKNGNGIGGAGNAWIAATNLPKPVPEPTTMLLLGIGLTGLAYFARKKFLK